MICKDMLVVAPTNHILRGFLFERTLERQTYFFWRVVMPLYRPARAIILNYSRRIPHGDKFHLARQEQEAVADRIGRTILGGHLAYLHRMRGPEQFLEHIAQMSGNTTRPFRLDLALTHYMLGNVADCTRILEELAASEGTSANSGIVSGLLDDMRADPARAARRLEAWEDANIAQFGGTVDGPRGTTAIGRGSSPTFQSIPRCRGCGSGDAA
jgi:hypothetical protein